MLYCIYTESVNTHIYKLLVAVYKIIIYLRVFGVQVEAVAVQCHDLNIVVIEVAAACIAVMVIYLIRIHLCTGRHRHIASAVRRPYIYLDRAEVFLAPVAGVVENNVLNDLHALSVAGIDKILICNAVGFVSVIYCREIVCMIAVVVIA